MTPLMWAAYRGYLDIVKELVTSVAVVKNKDDSTSGTTSHVFHAAKEIKTLQTCTPHGLDIHAINVHGFSPIMLHKVIPGMLSLFWSREVLTSLLHYLTVELY